MKKLLSLLLVFTLVLSLAGCKSKEEDKMTTEETSTTTATTEAATTTDTTTAPATEKVLKLIETSNIPSLITWQATDSVSFLILGNVNSGLYTLGEGGIPVPDLAESVEVAPDGLTYTFHLRQGVQWSTVDAQPYAEVTANDFIFAWKKLLDPKEAAQYNTMIATASIKNGKEAVALNTEIVTLDTLKKELEGLKLEDFKDEEGKTAQQQFDAAKADLTTQVADAEKAIVDAHGSLEEANTALQTLIDSLGVTAVDNYTLKVELSNPVPFFIDLMTFPALYPANEKFATEKGDAYGKTNADFLYNGAFIFKEWKLSERHYLVKNPLYWDAANTKLDAIDFRVVEGAANDTVVQMYLDGEIQTAALAGENVEKYGNRPDAVSKQDTVIFYLDVNFANGKITPEKEVLADAGARKALNMAIDKTYITDVIFANGSLPADYFVPKGFQASADFDGKDFRVVSQDKYQAEAGYNAYNPTEAAKLWQAALDKTGYKAVELDCIIYQGDTQAKVGTHIKNELEKNLPGITVNILALPFSEKLTRTNEGDFELNWGGWGPDYPDAMTFLDMFKTGNAYNRGNYSNPAYDVLVDKAQSGELTAPDKTKERFEAMVEMEKILLGDDQVIVPLYQRAALGLRDPKILNWYPQTFGPDYIYKWVDLAQ